MKCDTLLPGGIYKPHPFAALFPLLEGEPFRQLVEDIRQHGVREPIVMLDGQVLDGRNRYLAARECGARIPTVEYDGTDPLGYVISLNLNRRHLNESQRAMVAAKVATLRDGQRQVGKFADVPSQAEAATMLSVSERSVRSAREVQEQGTPALIAEVEAGFVTVSAGAEVAKMPEHVQSQIVEEGPAAVRAAAREKREARGSRRKEAPLVAAWRRFFEERPDRMLIAGYDVGSVDPGGAARETCGELARCVGEMAILAGVHDGDVTAANAALITLVNRLALAVGPHAKPEPRGM